MKLYSNPASPFVRKVLVAARECALEERLEAIAQAVSPVGSNDALHAANPLGKIPTLVTEDGQVLFDSRVICEYLDGLHGQRALFPAPGEARWRALRRQAQADGLMDAAVTCRYETFLRPQALRWSDFVDGQMGKVSRALDVFEAEAGVLGEAADIGTITIGCALGYLDFRYPDLDWRGTRPALAGWYERFAARPSMQATVPRDMR